MMNKLIFLIVILLTGCNSFEKSKNKDKSNINIIIHDVTEPEVQNDKNDLSKLITATQVETGYYNSYHVKYRPRIIIKWKNISESSIDKTITIKGIFMLEDEIISENSSVLQFKGDVPFEPGLSKQIVLTGYNGFEYSKGYNNYNVICLIYINNKLHEKYSIKKEPLNNERI